MLEQRISMSQPPQNNINRHQASIFFLSHFLSTASFIPAFFRYNLITATRIDAFSPINAAVVMARVC